MSDLQGILKSVTESVQVIKDVDFRKIAFQEVLRHALGSGKLSADRMPPPGSAARKPSQRRPSSVAKPDSTGGVRPEVRDLELSPDEPGLLVWGKLTVDWKKFCWVLEAARLKNVDGLTNLEISYLVEKVFRESYRPEVVNNLKVQIKKGIVKSVVVKSGDRNYRIWRILASGIQEVSLKPSGKTE